MEAALKPFIPETNITEPFFISNKAIRRYLHYCNYNRKYLTVLLENNNDPSFNRMYRELIRGLIKNVNSKDQWKTGIYFDYFGEYLINMIISLTLIWLKDESEDYDHFMEFHQETNKVHYEFLNTLLTKE